MFIYPLNPAVNSVLIQMILDPVLSIICEDFERDNDFLYIPDNHLIQHREKFETLLSLHKLEHSI